MRYPLNAEPAQPQAKLWILNDRAQHSLLLLSKWRPAEDNTSSYTRPRTLGDGPGRLRKITKAAKGKIYVTVIGQTQSESIQQRPADGCVFWASHFLC